MRPLTKTTTSRTVQIWIAARRFLAERPHVGPSKMKSHRPARLDRHTLKDIGVEPGSPTWI